MTRDEQSGRIQGARELREHLLRDVHRPGYHFAIPEDIGRPGDPNGAFYANGDIRQRPPGYHPPGLSGTGGQRSRPALLPGRCRLIRRHRDLGDDARERMVNAFGQGL